jgi:Predicted transcriptional regulators containing the CopG/Arc/MetJ DNA-binding domain and a metal-binding domain
MSTIEKITISLPAELLAEVRAAVEAGEFSNTSEVVRDALRQWRRARRVIALNDDELRRLVTEGRQSGEPVDGEMALRALREKYAALADGR